MWKRPFGLGNCGHILKSYGSMIWFRSFRSDKKKKQFTRWDQKTRYKGVITLLVGIISPLFQRVWDHLVGLYSF